MSGRGERASWIGRSPARSGGLALLLGFLTLGCLGFSFLYLASLALAESGGRTVGGERTAGGGDGIGQGPGEPPRALRRLVAPGPPPAAPPSCGGISALSAAEARSLTEGAAAALDEPLTTAVTDRAGRVLAVYRKGTAGDLDDRAVGLARTGAFFSNDQAPLSSRTVRFVSGIHFPPGVAFTLNAALYGIENTNRGCDLNVPFLPGKEVPPARSVQGVLADLPCDAFDRRGCGSGPVTGKVQTLDADPAAVDPGGLPVFRGGRLVGGIGVAAAGDSVERTEFAALAAFASPALVGSDLSPLPDPLPEPAVVFIDGVRLPFVEQLDRPPGTDPGAPTGSFVLGPRDGGCVPEGFLSGPRAGASLSRAEVERVISQAVAVAERTRALIRLPLGSRTRMVLAVADTRGEILGLFRMPDATVFSIDVAVAKARNVVWFSSPAGKVDLPGVPSDIAITNRTISFASQPLYPPGIDGTAPGPAFQGLFEADLARPCSQGSQPPGPNQNGVVFFPGSIPLYRNGRLVGGLGVSGDGVEQDDYVSFVGAEGFQPPEDRWADRVFVGGVRLPFLKLPRNPEG